MAGAVNIITYRQDREKAIRDLAHHEIRYDELIMVDRFNAKVEVIIEHGVTLCVDDRSEVFKKILDHVYLMLFRNEVNFDFADQRWMLSDETGKLV